MRFKKTNELYDKYSKQFADKLDQIPETDQLDEFIRMLPSSAKVLDLGCGSGRDAEYLAKVGKFNVTGVDLSEGLIQEAKKRRPDINFQVMDMENLTFNENSFDGIWSKLTILHIDRVKLPEILGDILVILKPNGLLYLETKSGIGEAEEPVSFDPNESRLFVYYQVDELKTMLSQAGFENVEGYSYTIENKHATKTKKRTVVYGRKAANKT